MTAVGSLSNRGRAQPGNRHAEAAREAVTRLLVAKAEGDDAERHRATRQLRRELDAHIADIRKRRLS